MTNTPLTRLVQIHKAIAHPARLRLLAALRGGPLCVCQMTALLRLATSTVSEHLSELRKAGLIADRKEGRWVEYSLDEGAVEEGLFDSIWPSLESDPEAKADAVLLGELRKVPLDELCSANLDFDQLKRPRLAKAAEKAERIRNADGVSR